MVFRGRHHDTPYSFAFRDSSLTVEVGDRLVLASDRGGRLYSLFRNGRMHRRSLNGRVIRKWHDRRGRHHEWLSLWESDVLLDEASHEWDAILQAVRGRFWSWTQKPTTSETTELLERLERGARFTGRAGRIDAGRFYRVYGEVGILPPDHYLSLVLQATDGCLFGSCSFCTLYGRKFHVKSRAEFARHADEVRNYFGDSLALRRRAIFLGAANAIAVPMPRLTQYFSEIHARFGRPPRGIHAFADGFTGARKSVHDYRVLASLGLRRVYLGLESGDDALLEAVGKPSRSGDIEEAVAAMKEAGLSVGVMVMVGLGGRAWADSHVVKTADALNRMPLGEGDILYFSDLERDSGHDYPRRNPGDEDAYLDHGERRRQEKRIRERLGFTAAPHVADYSIREFVY